MLHPAYTRSVWARVADFVPLYESKYSTPSPIGKLNPRVLIPAHRRIELRSRDARDSVSARWVRSHPCSAYVDRSIRQDIPGRHELILRQNPLQWIKSRANNQTVDSIRSTDRRGFSSVRDIGMNYEGIARPQSYICVYRRSRPRERLFFIKIPGGFVEPPGFANGL